MTDLAVGQRLRSQVCTTEVIVIRAGSPDVEVTCGGLPMTTDPDQAELQPLAIVDTGAGNPMGKRFADEEASLELLVTRAGTATLRVDGRDLQIKQPKNLPSSD